MKMELFFNKIWVIESLPKGEIKTGNRLYEDKMLHLNIKYPNISCEISKIESKVEVLDLLDKIKLQCDEHEVFPIIHLECHGDEAGLELANGDRVDWEGLREKLVLINVACRLNLLITVAACLGAYIIYTARRMDRVPFFAVIGVEKNITNTDLEEAFGAFYGEFFNSLDGDKSLKALNDIALKKGHIFQIYSARSLFVKAFRDYYRTSCIGKGKRSRIEDLVTDAMENPTLASKGVKWVRGHFKEMLSNPYDDLQQMKEKFFFIDLCSENEDRFLISFDNDIKK